MRIIEWRDRFKPVYVWHSTIKRIKRLVKMMKRGRKERVSMAEAVDTAVTNEIKKRGK